MSLRALLPLLATLLLGCGGAASPVATAFDPERIPLTTYLEVDADTLRSVPADTGISISCDGSVAHQECAFSWEVVGEVRWGAQTRLPFVGPIASTNRLTGRAGDSGAAVELKLCYIAGPWSECYVDIVRQMAEASAPSLRVRRRAEAFGRSYGHRQGIGVAAAARAVAGPE